MHTKKDSPYLKELPKAKYFAKYNNNNQAVVPEFLGLALNTQ